MDRIYRVEADINLDNIRWNLLEMRRMMDSSQKLLAVVKADAYGHGSIEVSKAIYDIVDFYAVAFIDEGIELIRNGIDKPVLILGYTDECDFEQLIEYDIRPAMYDVESCRILSDMALKRGKKVKVHIKVDTGMSRIGVPCSEEGINAIKCINDMPGIDIEGIFTHYAKADEYNKDSAKKQLADFTWINNCLKEIGIDIPIKHIANSAAIMELNDKSYNMVRSGIVTYGL
ncbi:MAG: alanine racemase, partial [Coprococcus sp.]